MNKHLKEFKNFASSGNMFDLALGVIIGGAFATVEINIPDGYKVESITPNNTITDVYGSYSTTTTFNNNKLTYIRRMVWRYIS
jgi:large-conductance mechanosensitive channel